MCPINSSPVVDFNHLYIVLDDQTYRAIQASDFLRGAFSGKEQRTTRTAAGESWAGTYFYTQENYLEFFGETIARPWNPEARAGWGGIAFSTDTPGGAQQVGEIVKKAFGYTPHFALRQLVTPNQHVNWFYNLRLAETVPVQAFDSWLMEYHPQIFDFKGIDYSASGPTRRAYLTPWNRADGLDTGGKPRAAAPLFQRILGATLQLERSAGMRYAEILQTLGHSVEKALDEIQVQMGDVSLTIRLTDPAIEVTYLITSIRLQMTRKSVAPVEFVFAPCSRLVLREDLTAEWRFGAEA